MTSFGTIVRSIVFAALLLATGNVAVAQPERGTGALELPALDRELGLRAGAFSILPYLKLGYGYDSNFFYNDDTQWESPLGTQVLKVAPGLLIKNRNVRNLKLDLAAEGVLDQYISDEKNVREQSNVGGDVSLKAGFFAQSPVSLVLHEHFRRALERRNYESTRNYNRNVNRVGAGLVFQPGGGALQVKGDYSFVADLFDSMANDWGDLVYHEVGFNGSWRFFPYTALVMDANWQFRDYLDDGGGRYGELTDSKPLRVRVGLNGFITKKLSLLLLAGYGNSMHEERDLPPESLNAEENDSFNMVVGEARVSMAFSPITILQVGYKFDFYDSLFTNYVQYHRVYVNFMQRVANRVDIEADVAYVNRQFSQLPKAYFEAATDPDIKANFWGLLTGYDRTDMVLMASLKVTADITRWLAFEASYNLELNNEPFNSGGKFGTCIYAPCDSAGTFRDYFAYNRHFVLGTLILRY